MLKIKNLTKVYKSKKGNNQTALDDVSLDFNEKGFVCILGKSGSGKSTLLNLIGGLDAPSKGDIIVNGENISSFSNKNFSFYRSGYLGFVFQDFNVLDDLTVFENVSISLELERSKPSYIKNKVQEVLTSLGIGDFINRKPNELSGGQLQRVAIARALVKDPQIILADEPTGNLDSESSKEALKLLKEQSQSKLVIMVTHDSETAEKYADRIIELKDGKVLSDYVNSIDKSNIEMEEVTIEETMIEKEPITEGDIDYPNNNNFEVKKSKLPNLSALKIGITNIIISKFRLLFTLILFSFTLVLFGFTIMVSNYDPNYSTAKSFEKSNIHNYDVEYCSSVVNLDSILDCLSTSIPNYFDTNNLSALSNNENIKIYPKVDMTTRILPGIYDKMTNTYLNYIKHYKYEPTFYYDYTAINDSTHYELVAGEFPEEPNEVVISDFVADYLFKSKQYKHEYPLNNEEDLIGRNILTNKPNLELKISGIFDTDYENYTHLFSIFAKESLSKKEQVAMNEFIIKRDSLYTTLLVNDDNYFNPLEVEITGLINSETFKKRMSFVNYNKYMDFYNESLMYPYKIRNLHSNEIVIRSSEIHKFFDFSDRDPIFLRDNFSVLDEFIGESITIYPNESQKVELDEEVEFKIVGIIVDKYMLGIPSNDNQSNYEIIVSPDVIDKVNNNKYFKGLIAYNYGNEVDNTNFLKQLEDNNFIHRSNLSLVLYTYEKTSETILPILILVNLAFGIFTIVLINSFTSFSITSKKKEIGILMAIGTKNKDVSKIFIFQSLIMGSISAVVAIISLYYLANIFNNIVSQDLALQLYIFNTGLTEYLSIFLLSLTIIILSSLFTTKLITNKHPIDAIKNR